MHKTQLIKCQCVITIVILWSVTATIFQVINHTSHHWYLSSWSSFLHLL